MSPRFVAKVLAFVMASAFSSSRTTVTAAGPPHAMEQRHSARPPAPRNPLKKDSG